MGVLVPLYLTGLTALSLPVIFHLVRRTPRGRQVFSSLMFLSPTLPKLTRRSRLDQLFLLALRLTALALLAFAFARPFLREAAALALSDLPGRRVAILIDNSASMRRGDLWQQAVRLAEKEIDDMNPQDDVALYAFDDRLHTLIDFDKEGVEAIVAKPQAVRNRLRALAPTWGATDLGTALVTVAGEIDATSDVRQLSREPQIAVISDFQKGARIEALQSFEWPQRVPVVIRQVTAAKTTNAFAQVLRGEADDETADLRVRVANAADSAGDQFFIAWAGNAAKADRKDEVAVYVPAGQSRVVHLPRNANSLQADRIILRGDDHDFDNTYFVVPPRKLNAVILYAGTDAADDAHGLQYYLRLAVANDPLRQVDVRTLDAAQLLPLSSEPTPPLAVVSQPLTTELQTALKSYVERGGMLVLVPANREAALSLSFFFDDVELKVEATDSPSDYLLLGDIDFTHPLFAPFAGPRYSDFTKIHFWKHRQVVVKTPAVTHVIARFDNGDPALLERTIGSGRVIAFTSGWQPEESQLALSSKFVPLIGGLLDQACGGQELSANVAVHDPVPLLIAPRDSSPKSRAVPARSAVQPPSGREINLPPGATTFTETDQPGIYRTKANTTEWRFAVNLAAAESNTAPLDLEQLEQRGVRIGAGVTRAERIDRVRQQRDLELEGRQKVWRWLIAGALCVLILETWWAGRAERTIKETQLVPSTLPPVS